MTTKWSIGQRKINLPVSLFVNERIKEMTFVSNTAARKLGRKYRTGLVFRNVAIDDAIRASLWLLVDQYHESMIKKITLVLCLEPQNLNFLKRSLK